MHTEPKHADGADAFIGEKADMRHATAARNKSACVTEVLRVVHLRAICVLDFYEI